MKPESPSESVAFCDSPEVDGEGWGDPAYLKQQPPPTSSVDTQIKAAVKAFDQSDKSAEGEEKLAQDIMKIVQAGAGQGQTEAAKSAATAIQKAQQKQQNQKQQNRGQGQQDEFKCKCGLTLSVKRDTIQDNTVACAKCETFFTKQVN